MSASGRTICLSMIVKNEAAVIRRCLESVRSVIDYWVIVDTGSTDGTQALIRDYFSDVPGELHERPWRDFAHNRSEALALARPHAGYSLIIDADDALEVPPGFRPGDLTADSYVLDIEDVGIRYQRTQLVANRLPWRYRGVLHEFLACDGAGLCGHFPVLMRRNHDGARRRDPETYRKDAAILARALQGETDPFMRSRYTFYLAQSYRDCGEPEQALNAYMARADLGFWNEEIFVGLLQAARLMEALQHSHEDVIATYLRASDVAPLRAEALHGASRLCRYRDRFEEGHRLAKRGLAIAPAPGGLFIEPWITDYGLLDELAVNGYWAGEYQDCLTACDRLLREGKMPADMRGRVEANRAFAADKLVALLQPPRAAAPSSTWAPTRPQGGTELMVEGLRQRLGSELDEINLCVNDYDPAQLDGRPLVVWIHHNIDQVPIRWLRDQDKRTRVDWFVLVSNWQKERFVDDFGLRPDRCVVLRNATEVDRANRAGAPRRPLKMAYTSTPYRGLAVLLDAWELLRPQDAELHIWSSHKLYGPDIDDTPYQVLYDRAAALPGVVYHGIVPNAELRRALRQIDVLVYPSTFEETSCLSVIEAMAAGCRVICPSLGALSETVGRFGKIYPPQSDPAQHAKAFAQLLAEEIERPWDGRPEIAEAQQNWVRDTYDWAIRAADWRRFLELVLSGPSRSTATSHTSAPFVFKPRIKKILSKRGTFFVAEQDFIAQMIERSGDWEPHLYDFAAMALNADSNIIDLGANFGFHTVGLAKMIPQGQLFAFEPLNLCFSQLQMNVIQNRLRNVRAFKMAVTQRSGDVVEMEPLEATMTGSGTVNLGHTAIGSGGDLAFTASLDDMIFPKIDFIKVDVQGSESDAFDGMRMLLSRDRPVVFVEIEEAHLRRNHSSSVALIERFMALAYSLIWIETEWPTDHLAIPNERVDLIAACQNQAKYKTHILAGTEVELVFENSYYYSSFKTR